MDADPQRRRGLFATTHWGLVLAAGDGNTPEGAVALEQLCRNYWFPLYAYVRRRGYSAEDAEDLTQQFFAHLLERDAFSLADPARGRFRTFLLASLQHFLTDEWKRAHRAKRGGGAFQLPLDGAAAANLYAAELTNTTTPERVYEERWALALLDTVLQGLSEEYSHAGKAHLFEVLQDSLWGSAPSAPLSVTARDLGMSEGAVRAALHRLREHYRERLWTEVSRTVSHPGEVEAELRHLIRCLGNGSD